MKYATGHCDQKSVRPIMTLRRSNRRMQAASVSYKDENKDESLCKKRKAPTSPESSCASSEVKKVKKTKRAKQTSKKNSNKKKKVVFSEDSDTADESIVESPPPAKKSTIIKEPESGLGSDWRVSSVMDY